jgi:hypothetical protein
MKKAGRTPEPTTFEEGRFGPYAFFWDVAVDGYRWETELKEFGNTSALAYLVECPEGGYTTYTPLKIRDLHRRFAKLSERTNGMLREEILDFANEYGLLGCPRDLWKFEGDRGELAYFGERDSDWRIRFHEFTCLLRIWDFIRTDDKPALRKIIQWSDDGTNVWVKGFAPSPTPAWNLAEKGSPRTGYLIDQWPRLSVIAPAKHFLYREINRVLAEQAAPQIFTDRPGESLIMPKSLLGAIYVLFALEVGGIAQPPIQCPGCGEYFVPHHGRQRHCSDSCRQKSYTRRKKEALKDNE